MTTKAFSRAKIEVTAEDKTKSAFSSVQSNVKAVTGAVFSMTGALVAAAGVGGMGMLVKSSLEAGDSLAKMADRVGTTTQALAGMRHAGELAGVSTDSLDSSLEKMTVNLSRATEGTGKTAEAMDELGLSATELAMMPTDQALGEIADAMQDVELATDRARIAQDIFGKGGLDMINMLDGGSAALEEAAAEADAFGLAISRVDAAKIEAANDAMFRAEQAVAGVGMSIAVGLSPYIEAATNLFVDAAKEANGWQDEIVAAIKGIVVGVAYLMDIVQGLEFAWQASQLAFSAMAEVVMAGVEMIAAPIVKLLSLIPGLGVEFAAVMGEIEEASARVQERSAEILGKMDEIALGGRASDKAKEFFEQIEEAAQEFGEQVAEKQEARRDKQISMLDDHLGVQVNMHQKHSKEVVDIKEKELDALEKFTQASYGNQTDMIMGELDTTLKGMDASAKSMFGVTKMAATSTALVSASESAARTMGAYPYPINVGLAAASYIAAMTNVSAISGIGFGSSSGGGSPPSGGGSIPPIDVPNIPGDEGPGDEGSGGNDGGNGGGSDWEQERTDIEINLHGAGYSKEDVRNLIYQINEEISDGVKLKVA